MELIDLTTFSGIAILAGVIIELLKRLLGLENTSNKTYSLLILGISLVICLILGLISTTMLDVELMTGLYNGLSAWILSTFGYQLIKGSAKIIKK